MLYAEICKGCKGIDIVTCQKHAEDIMKKAVLYSQCLPLLFLFFQVSRIAFRFQAKVLLGERLALETCLQQWS